MGLDERTLDKHAGKERSYTVRLHFIEPEDARPGQRIFSVALEGRTVLKDLDSAREAGSSRRPLVKEFTAVRVTGDLNLTLTPSASARAWETILCGLEVISED